MLSKRERALDRQYDEEFRRIQFTLAPIVKSYCRDFYQAHDVFLKVILKDQFITRNLNRIKNG